MMKSTIRTFIAINIAPDKKLLDYIEIAKSKFSNEKMKWVNTNNLHLTLRFLGETTNDQIQQISNSLVEIVKQTGRFTIKLKGIDFFKNRGTPKVLYVNINEEKNNLNNLVRLIDEVVGKSGFETNEKRYYPHLTLARIKFLNDKERFQKEIGEWKDIEFQSQTLNEIIFYQSILNEKEPNYIPLAKYKLI